MAQKYRAALNHLDLQQERQCHIMRANTHTHAHTRSPQTIHSKNHQLNCRNNNQFGS